MIRINLLPQKKKMQLPKLPIGTILGVLILIGLGYYLWVIQQESFQAQLDDLDTQIKEKTKEKARVLQDKQEKLAAIDQQINLFRQQISLVKRLIGSDMVPWSVVFEDLTYLVPKETVWLKSFQCEGDAKILMQGTARSDPNLDQKKNEGKKIMTSIAKFITNLDECFYIDNVYLSTSQIGQMHGQDIYSFSLSAKIDRTKKNGDAGGASSGGGSGDAGGTSGGGASSGAGTGGSPSGGGASSGSGSGGSENTGGTPPSGGTDNAGGSGNAGGASGGGSGDAGSGGGGQ